MNAWEAGTSSQFFGAGLVAGSNGALLLQFVPALPSGPRVISGSSDFSGMNTVSPVLTVWSTPWSKNWPKKVNTELNGGERPTSVVMFGMNRVWCCWVQPAGCNGTTSSPAALTSHGTALGVPSWARTGRVAAATAAGLVEVWSTIRLLITRGCESTTLPLVCL